MSSLFIVKKTLVFFFIMVIFPVLSLFAQPYDMILAGDPVLEDLRYLSLEAGKPFLSFTPPLAPQKVEQYLNSIDASLLSLPAQEAFYRIEKRLRPQTPLSLSFDNFSVSININSTIEARARYNEEIAWYPLYPKIPPVISLPIKLHFFNFLQFYLDPYVVKLPNFYLDEDWYGTNVMNFDLRSPLKAFAAAGGSWWDFQLGRDRLSYGTGHMGNLVISDNDEYYEFLRFSFFNRVLKYSSLIMQMPLQTSDSLYTIKNPNSLGRSIHRYFYLHRFDINLFNVLSIGLMEGLMVGNSPLELRYLNPIMIFHSYYSGYDYGKWADTAEHFHSMLNGSIFGVEVNWNIIKSFAFYGQFVVNQFAGPTEEGIQPPNGLGFMAGLQYSHSFDSWASTFFFEFTSTFPYLYMSSSPFASFIHMRPDHPSSGGRKMYSFIGYPRDLMVFTLGTRFFKNDITKISGLFSIHLQGEHDIRYDWEMTEAAFNKKNPSGIAEEKYIVSVAVQRKLSSLFAINGSVTGIISRNNNHSSGSNETGLQSAFSVSFSY